MHTCKRKKKMKMAVTLPLHTVQGMLVEKTFILAPLGRVCQSKIDPPKKCPAGLASPYIQPQGFVFTWKVHPLSGPYQGFTETA